MGSFGENLRREREMRGVTLEEISAATKIGVRFLKAIEDEDFARLPGGIFSRSFVRSYAHYLGLDEDPVVTEYQLAAKGKREADLPRSHVFKPNPARPRRSRSSPMAAVIGACVLLAASYSLWRHSRQPHKTLAETPVSQAAAHQHAPSASAAVPTESESGSVNSTEAKPSAVLPAVETYGNSLVLQVSATERAWVAVDADGKTVMQGVMNPGDSKTLKARESFDVLTGNAHGVLLTLDGQKLKSLGSESQVKSVHLTAADLKPMSSP